MKRTQFTDARRNVRKEIIAYISIVVIGLLAAVAYLSVAYSAVTLKKDALRYFNDRELWDYEITSTLLLDEEDIAAIRALPDVKEVEPVLLADGSLHIDGDITKVAVMNVPARISLPVLLEGRIPEKAGECAVEKVLAEDCGLSVGQRIEPEITEYMGIAPLAEKSLIITGVFQTPDNITHMIQATPVILVAEDGFDREALDGCFMKARVRVENTPEDRYSEAYWQTVDPVGAALEVLGGERGAMRREKIRGMNLTRIEEGEEKLEEAAEQLRQMREMIDAGYRDLEAAAEQLGVGKELLDSSSEQLSFGELQLLQGAGQLNEFRNELEALRPFVEGDTEWTAVFVAGLDLPEDLGVTREEFLQALENGAGMDWLYEATGFNDYERQFTAASAQFFSARNEWYRRGEEYLDAMTQLDRGRKKLEEGRKGLEVAQAEYDAGAQLLEEGREELDKLPECRWILISDLGNAGYVYARENADKLASLSMSFSSIFLVVGALVIYATISRMVEQHRKLIGATKALGLYNREVFAKYLFFALSAVMLGVGLGILLAWLPLQRAILQSYEKLFTYGTGTRSFLLRDTALVVAGSFVISLIAVYLGCGRLLRQPAIRLMQEAIPSVKRGKAARRSAEKSLYSRLIFRNMRTDRVRVLVTIVSIAGGCMLMVIGFTLRYGIGAVTERQFGGIMTYEADVFYDAGENAEAGAEIGAILEDCGLDHVAVRKANTVFEAKGVLNALTLIVADRGGMEGFYSLRGITDDAALDLPESGALVPRRFREYYDLGVGDTVPVYGNDMELRELGIAGVFENYFGQTFFLTPQSYEEVFHEVPENNCFFVRTGGMSLEELREKLQGVEGFLTVNDAAADRSVIEQFSASLIFVVWFMLFIAGLMACFIVANFTMTYLQRKTRELTVMRINGFSSGECIRYAAVDLIVTTVLGTILGLALGGVAGYRILMITETPYIQMAREPVLRTYLYSALITCGFSLQTNGLALRRVRKLKLSDMS